MLHYAANLKGLARKLRKNQTDSESLLWSHLRGKQFLGVEFYRQKPIGPYIVDFFGPRVKLIIEVDGSQHMEGNHFQKDKNRDAFLEGLGLSVLRFNSRVVLTETAAVLETIYRKIEEHLDSKISPDPPFSKGGRKKEYI